jgi:hypothetical protein
MQKAQVKQKRKRQSLRLSYKYWSDATPMLKFYR